MRVSARLALAGAVAMVAVASPVTAQSKGLELNGFLGYYVPTSTDGLQSALFDASRRGSLQFGGRLTYWTGNAVGLEFTGGFSPARVSVTSTAGRFPRSTQLSYGSAKLMLNLTPGSKLIGLAIGGGVAGLKVRKTVADPTKSTTDVGGVGGVSLRINVGENVALRGDLEDVFYGGSFGRGNKFTQDLVLSAGLALKL